MYGMNKFDLIINRRSLLHLILILIRSYFDLILYLLSQWWKVPGFQVFAGAKHPQTPEIRDGLCFGAYPHYPHQLLGEYKNK
jgi:hypothetical protein